MFAFRRRESCPIQLYGKLPLAKDYLRVGCGSGAGRALREWLDAEFSGSSRQAEPPELAWPLRFLIGGRRHLPLLGSAWPSSDAGGLRRFPIVVFVERRRKPLWRDVADGLPLGRGLWRRIEAVYGARENYTDGRSLLGALRGRELRADDLEPRPPEGIALEEWIDALWPEARRDGLDAMLLRLKDLVGGAHRGALRLPLVADLPTVEQVHAWWTVLTHVGWLASGASPSLFFPQTEASASNGHFVTVLPDEPASGDARWLSPPGEVGGRAEGALCDGPARRAPDPAPRPESLPPLADSLRAVLVALSGRKA